MPQTTSSADISANDAALTTQAVLAGFEVDVADWDLTSPPGSPSVGARYLVARGATGAWYTWDDDFAIYVGSGVWRREMAHVGSRAYSTTRGLFRTWNGRAWLSSDGLLGVTRGGLAASATQEQGQVPLAHALCRITTCATANDAVTLPPAAAGQRITVANDGAETLQVFPDVGDAIDAGAANASVTIAAGKRRIFEGDSASHWISILGA